MLANINRGTFFLVLVADFASMTAALLVLFHFEIMALSIPTIALMTVIFTAAVASSHFLETTVALIELLFLNLFATAVVLLGSID
jgi:hypothetical protein